MVTISGIYYRNNKPVDTQYISQLSGIQPVQETPHHSPNILFISQQNATNRLAIRQSHLSIVGDIELYNVNELKASLHIRENGHDAIAIVLEAYKKWGAACTQHLIGDFVFAIWDEQQQQLFCARDQVGQKPLYYYLDEDVFIFSNKIHFPAQFKIAAHIDEDWPGKMLSKLLDPEDRSQTIYSNIKRLIPAHTLTVRENDTRLEKYWELNNKSQQKTTNIDEGIEGLRWHIDNAVKLRLDAGSQNGVELSGGLDSSSIAAFAQRYLHTHQQELWCFSNTLPPSHKNHYEGFTDESARIGLVANHLKIKNHIYFDQLAETPLAKLAAALEYVGYPTNANISISQQDIYQSAHNNGVSKLLSGFGGDEIVSSNLYRVYVDGLIRSGKPVSAAKQVRKRGNSFLKSNGYAFSHYFHHLLKTGKSPIHLDYNDEIPRLLLKELQYGIKKHPPSPSPQNAIRQAHINKLNAFPLVERLETGYLVTDAYNIRYKYPLWHTPLLEYFYNLPDEWKVTHKHGRGLFRKAIKGILPDEIAEVRKPRDTYVIPVLKMEIEKYFQFHKDWLLSQPANHHIFDYLDKAKLEQVVQHEETESRTYEMMRKMVMFTMFFDKRHNTKLYDV